MQYLNNILENEQVRETVSKKEITLEKKEIEDFIKENIKYVKENIRQFVGSDLYSTRENIKEFTFNNIDSLMKNIIEGYASISGKVINVSKTKDPRKVEQFKEFVKNREARLSEKGRIKREDNYSKKDE